MTRQNDKKEMEETQVKTDNSEHKAREGVFVPAVESRREGRRWSPMRRERGDGEEMWRG